MPKFRWALPEQGKIHDHPTVCLRIPDIAGATVHFSTFAISLMPEDIENFIDKGFPSHVDLLTKGKMVGVRSTTTKILPEGMQPRLAKMLIPIKKKGSYPCIAVVIAINMAEEDLDRANIGPQAIKKRQDDSLGVTDAPGWFRVINNFNGLCAARENLLG
ncbi:hypothetical protein BKA70DRAFT_1524704 [Coprinopsis sp. MPI-PUGE-AT-0042]|nr:hypothetical protein BKA70DRAFT_1524704 [Coprinopsis sp. MPI-PUGE-AT-0042]